MPYIYDPNLDPNNNNNTGQVQLSGASGVSNAPAAASGAAPQSRDVKSGSGFQNLDKYFQGGQAQQFGNEFLGNVEQKVQNAGTQMNQAADQFKAQVQAGGGTQPTQDQLNQALAHPESADVNQFKDWRTQTYKGPTSLADASSQDAWNKYWSGTKQAQTQAGLLGNEAGRFTLLDEYYKKPTYTMGQKSLDNLFVQQSGLGGQTRDIQNEASQLQSRATSGEQDLRNMASQRASDVDTSRNQVLSAIGLDASGNATGSGALGQQYQSINDYVAQQNAARRAQQDAFRANLASDRISNEDAMALGLGGVQGQNLYDLDINNYVSMGGDLNKNQVMTPEQRARVQALSQLGGITDTFASGAPEAASAAYGFDINRLKSDAQGRAAAYNNDLQQHMVSIPAQWTAGGKGAPIPLSELRARIAQTEARQNSGNTTEVERRGNIAFLNDARAALAKGEAEVGSQYKTDRAINGQTASISRAPSVYGYLGMSDPYGTAAPAPDPFSFNIRNG